MMVLAVSQYHKLGISPLQKMFYMFSMTTAITGPSLLLDKAHIICLSHDIPINYTYIIYRFYIQVDIYI